MSEKQLVLSLDDKTLEAMEQLGYITAREGLGTVIRDALRVYEWLIRQQAEGRTIIVDEETELAQLFPPDRQDAALAYFELDGDAR
jgi:hypothetical protein